MSTRRQAREAVLKALYLSECRNMNIDKAFDEMASFDTEIDALGDSDEAEELKPFALGIDEQQKMFAIDLSHRIVDSSDELDDHIKPALVNWEFSRIARIDRHILWIAIAEMEFFLDIPVTVSIDEAIELAKKYSSEKSPSFINGVLDKVARDIGALKKDDE